MEQTGSNMNPVLYVILILVLANLAATGYLILNQRTGQLASVTTGGVPLPTGLDSSDKRNALLEQFRVPYNAKDYDGIYNLFSPAARLQINKENLISSLNGLYVMTGNIKTGAYRSYKGEQVNPNTRAFTLTYVVEVENGLARLEMDVVKESEDPYRLVGFNLIMTMK